ncbi:MAG: hypothetical protein AUG49_18910 [Catenulispora sp. 13_1_20CM_3_70_7]|nr:MAG: hypothetical protein AUG49_18910 [Catenulispora sp. 13_1_20CM_3_70_7]
MNRDELIKSVTVDGGLALAAVAHALRDLAPLPVGFSAPATDDPEEIAAALDSMNAAAQALYDLPMPDALRRTVRQSINMWVGGVCALIIANDLGNDGPLYVAERLFSYTEQAVMLADAMHRGEIPEAEETAPDEIALVQYGRANRPIRKPSKQHRKPGKGKKAHHKRRRA